MSILDDAIREHLELKRAHGAGEAELKKLEDEAFGPPGRPEEPDPFAEAPTQFMTTEGAEATDEESGSRRINVADLQEPPPPEQKPATPAEDPEQAAPPGEEAPAMEHEIVSEPPEGERHAIAEQPTELFDVEAEMDDDAPAAEVPSPSDEEIAAAELSEPKLAPAEPATEIHASRAEAPPEPAAEEDEEDEEFWSDQRLSEELDQALEAPITDESELPPLTEEHEAPPPAAAEPSTPTAEPAAVYEDAATEGEHDEEDEQPQADYDPDTGHEDVLEDTPDFLEDAPEDDELWFEQKPPKDFDFDD
jgi:hypothetical protein